MPKPSKSEMVRKWNQKQRLLSDAKKRLEVGQKVLTKEPKHILDGDWTEEALQERRYGVLGEICKVRDAHGVCYEVRHSDDSTAYYDPWELEIQK